jgi:iron(III) transport system ATP-binding protein
MEPSVVLLDEPLANLDVHLREAMQSEFRAFHADTAATMVYVTHDQAEAMALADRIAVMSQGRLEQMATPRTLYHEPASAMVAEFVGRGMVVPVQVRGGDGNGGCVAELLGAVVALRAGDAKPGPALACLRAERLDVARERRADRIPATVVDATYRGPVTSLYTAPLADPGRRIAVDVSGEAPEPGTPIHLVVKDGWRIPG